MKSMRSWTISLFVCAFIITGPLHAHSVVSLPTANSVEEALQLMDAFAGEAEDFRVGIPEQLFDAAGVNAARITDHALSRGWASDGFMQILTYRVYRFKNRSAQQAVQPDRREDAAPG
jgi:hypothetical protein